MMTATRASGAWQTAFHRSIEDPEAFWSEAGAAIHWYKKWDKVLDDSRAPFYRWFTGGQLNTCFNALDRHVRDGSFTTAPSAIKSKRLRTANCATPPPDLRACWHNWALAKATASSFICRWFPKR